MLDFSSKYYRDILLQLQSAGGVACLVGGCVRDALLKKTTHDDIDIATTLLPGEVINILSQKSIQVIHTGIKFGTVTAIVESEKFEITTLRKDIKSNGRHATVIFTNDFKEDALRRDFTINAMSYCPFKDKIYDYCNGQQDLKHRRVIFIGDPSVRIKEDYLRILRFFRFSALYADAIDEQGLAGCIKLKEGLNLLSKERIKQEMDKLIIVDNAPIILQQMFDNAILPLILPVVSYNQGFLVQAAQLELQMCTRYALLFYPHLNDLVMLKFSRKESNKISLITNFINQEKCDDFIMRKTWLEEGDYTEYLLAAAIVGKAEMPAVRRFINKYGPLKKPTFPLTGYDLLKQKIQNKDIKHWLSKLKSLWIKSDFTSDKETLLSNLP